MRQYSTCIVVLLLRHASVKRLVEQLEAPADAGFVTVQFDPPAVQAVGADHVIHALQVHSSVAARQPQHLLQREVVEKVRVPSVGFVSPRAGLLGALPLPRVGGQVTSQRTQGSPVA